MKALPLERAYRLLEPSPVILVTTAHRGRANVMTMSWHMVVDFVPLFAIVMSSADYSFKALRATRECVIAVPGVDLIEKVVDVGNCSGEDVDKFQRFGLTPLPAAKVQAPLVAECLANIECRVMDTRFVHRYDVFIVEGIKAWTTQRRERRTFHAQGDGTFLVDGRMLDLKRRMVKFAD